MKSAPALGEIIPYWFLWLSEHEAGEESGRKLRPCVVLATIEGEGKTLRVAVLPITHSKPPSTRAAIEIPAAVKKRLNLSGAPSRIVCDEFNEFIWPGVDLGKTPRGMPSFGHLPRGVLAAARAAFTEARARGRLVRDH